MNSKDWKPWHEDKIVAPGLQFVLISTLIVGTVALVMHLLRHTIEHFNKVWPS